MNYSGAPPYHHRGPYGHLVIKITFVCRPVKTTIHFLVNKDSLYGHLVSTATFLVYWYQRNFFEIFSGRRDIVVLRNRDTETEGAVRVLHGLQSSFF